MTKAQLTTALSTLPNNCTIYINIFGQAVDIEDIDIVPQEDCDDDGSKTAIDVTFAPAFAILIPGEA